MWSLDSTQQILAILLALGALVPLFWKLFDLLSKTWDRKNVLEMLAGEKESKLYWKGQTEECRGELGRCQERHP